LGRKKQKQLALGFPNGWGGSREGSGRKRSGSVQHEQRPVFSRETAAHITVRFVEDLPSMRRDEEYWTLYGVMEKSCDRDGFRIVHFSVQTTHMHLIVEAQDREHLTRGMRGFLVRASRALNRLWNRHGRVVAERFHEHLLRAPREARNAIAYVLNNARHHGAWIPEDLPDPRSSGRFFDGWLDFAAQHIPGLFLPVAAARTWLLTVGWRRHGPIPVGIVPGT
jgi:REP element-mobilizing transposase RayT